MKLAKTYRKLSLSEKKSLIKRALNGESISKIAKESSISRIIFYRWLKEYSTQHNTEAEPLLPKNPKGRKHWRKLTTAKEQEIISLWKNNPGYSIRKIAYSAQVSIGGAWNVVRQYKKKTQESGKNIKRYIKSKYNIVTEEEKVELIHRYYKGEPIAKICRDAGISRTIFYRWLRSFEHPGTRGFALKRSYPRGEGHWRFVPGVRDLVLETVSINPNLSLTGLVERIRHKGQNISKSGLYYMLKRMKLSSHDARLAYSASANSMVIQRQPSTGFPKRFATLTLLSFFAACTLFFMLNHPFKIGNPITTIDSTPTPTEASKENYSKDATENKFTPPQTAEQDLGWGALAVNTPKDTYTTGEEIQMGFGIVDHAGNTVCNADIGLEMVDLEGQKIFESGVSGEAVRHSGECSLQSVTSTPDYLVNIPPMTTEGEYEIRITAVTYEGEKKFSRKLVVKKAQMVSISRTIYPTRIFPLANYPVEIEIKPEHDFKGNIADTLPKGITASSISGAGMLLKEEKTNDRIIRWAVDFKKGQTYNLSYSLHFPKIWPEFYEIGPLRLEDSSGKLVFQEARYWQIVADAL